ncbi:MAG TPA: response regulator [Nitrospira sp.]|nr:response regulator [Nitrospira sp.]
MDGYGKRALIIDDNEDILHWTGITLMDRGYNVYTASDGFGGSEQMKKRRYDVVLVDYHMPRLNGLQFIEMCRMMWPEIPIILMSVDDYVTHHSDHIKGIFGSIAKPFEPPQLIELVNQACRNVPQKDQFRMPCDSRKADLRSFPLKGPGTSLQTMSPFH